jgi:hypothetical protein
MNNKNLMQLCVLICLVFISCTKEEPEPTPSGNGGNNTAAPTEWGKLIPVPEVNGSEDFVGNLQTTSRGVYMEVNLNNAESEWIYRMNSGSEAWIKTVDVETYYFWEPLNYYYEYDDQFSYFYSGVNTSGLISINTGDPFQLSDPHNFDGFSGNTQMLIDNSSSADTWRLTWSEVQVKQPNELNLFNTLFTFPQVDPFYRALADPSENCIWLTNGSSIIYQIYASGTINTWDVAALTGIQAGVGKIAFSHLPDHTDVYFEYGNSYMRIDERTTLQTFYTDPVGGAMSFTVDNNYLYATDGKKINLSSGEVGTFIPPSPGFEDMDLYTDYFNKTFWLTMSTDLEVLKNDGDAFIYSIYDNKIFRMPKNP